MSYLLIYETIDDPTTEVEVTINASTDSEAIAAARRKLAGGEGLVLWAELTNPDAELLVDLWDLL